MPEKYCTYRGSAFWHLAKILDSLWNREIKDNARKRSDTWINLKSYGTRNEIFVYHFFRSSFVIPFLWISRVFAFEFKIPRTVAHSDRGAQYSQEQPQPKPKWAWRTAKSRALSEVENNIKRGQVCSGYLRAYLLRFLLQQAWSEACCYFRRVCTWFCSSRMRRVGCLWRGQ